MCYGFVWFDFASSKQIPDDPLTRKPSRSGLSGACRKTRTKRFYGYCWYWLWMFLFIILFLLFLYLMGARLKQIFPTLPFFYHFSHSPNENVEGNHVHFNPGAPGGGGSSQNRPDGDDINEGMAPLTRADDDGGNGDGFSESSTTNSYTNPHASFGNQGASQDANNMNNNNNNPGQNDPQNSRGWFGWGSGSSNNQHDQQNSAPSPNADQRQGQGQGQDRQIPNSENQGTKPTSIKVEHENRGWFGWGKSSSPESVNKDPTAADGNEINAKSKNPNNNNKNNNDNLNSNGKAEKFGSDSGEKRKGGSDLGQSQGQSPSSRIKRSKDEWRPTTGKKNYALCEDGAFEYRVLNFPPFRGKESEHATYHILKPGLDTNVKWHFNPPGDVIIKLSQPISIDGMTLIHISPERKGHLDKDFSTTPKNFELYGTSEKRGISKGIHNPVLLGRFQFTHRQDGFQYFPVQTISNERFSHVELRFLNSYENPEFVDVYRIEVHGKP